MNFSALDIETASNVPEYSEYALQPWRVDNFDSCILMVTTFGQSGKGRFVKLEQLEKCTPGKSDYIWTWNGIFDVSFLIAAGGLDCSKFNWLDAMSAAKWCLRSQATDPPGKGARFSWSLGNVAKLLLKDWDKYDEFLDIKEEFKTDSEYLKKRGILDAEATYLIGMKCWNKFTTQQKKSFLLEQKALYQIAKAQIVGYRYDFKGIKALAKKIESNKNKILRHLKIDEKVISSPDQLACLLFDKWRIPFDDKTMKTKTGKRSTDKATITFLIEKYVDKWPQLLLIQKFRELNSRYAKFVKGPMKCKEYLGSETLRHVWKYNSTYTGRCTVSSKCNQKEK
jgi:DNA polymerase I-like protein with 3'-5' exonuclease and polymerase domains